ncbi:AIPR family protein [Aliarcobacter butzleri]
MANRNDFKLLNIKCLKYFKLLKKEYNIDDKNITEIDKKRFGFYLFMLEDICNVKDFEDLIPMITDKEFNSVLFKNNNDDCGVDAIHIDKENFLISLFTFKYRENFDTSGQKVNDVIITSKFLNALELNNTSNLSGKIKSHADDIITYLNSDNIWKIKLYVISNENQVIKPSTPDLSAFAANNDLTIIPIGLDYISEIMSIRPQDIEAKLVVNKDSILTYSENEISTSKSYVIKLPLIDLIRITSNNSTLRIDYSLNNMEELSNVDIDYSVLFDNVRGFIKKSAYNDNIGKTLKEYPEKFFMFNNGITIVAKEIKVISINANRKFLIELNGIQIVNGGQTLRSIHKFNNMERSNLTEYLSKGEVLVRLFLVNDLDDTKNKIAEFTNSQNSISPVDLKSLRPEQIQLEQYLSEKGIIYSRKSGDIGLDEMKEYEFKISMEKFGQILFALKGFPEKSSNQKKQIFDKKYDDIFNSNEFNIEDSEEIIKKYHEITNIYKELKFEFTEQKGFYILYLNKKNLNKTLIELINLFENSLNEFGKDLEISNARKLIKIDFKNYIDSIIK